MRSVTSFLTVFAATAAVAGARAGEVGGSFRPGAVYTSTNDPAGNEVVVHDRGTDGVLSLAFQVPTGGTGTGAGLGNQGAVRLTADEKHLLVVNAGSHDLSLFEVGEQDLALVQRIATEGLQPVSVAQHDDLVYVLNAGSDRVAGYRLTGDGFLRYVGGSQAHLSGVGTAPAQIEFSPDGAYLYVTEKATNLITSFALDVRGRPRDRRVLPSEGMTPFGFAFGLRDQLFVSEAAGGQAGLGTVTSYRLGGAGFLDAVSPTVANGETAPCWVVVTPDGRLVYVSNTGTDSISSFEVGFDGDLTLLDAQAASTGDRPLDMALSNDGRFLYVLDAGAGEIGDYRVESDGSLTSLPGSNSGLPGFASGLAAR